MSLLESFTAVADERPPNALTSLDPLSLLADTSYSTVASVAAGAAGAMTRSEGGDNKRGDRKVEEAAPLDANDHRSGKASVIRDEASSTLPASIPHDSPLHLPPHSIQTAKLVQLHDSSLDVPKRWQQPTEPLPQPSSPPSPPPLWSGAPMTPPRYDLTDAHRKVPMSAESLPLRRACRFFREKYGAQTPPPSQRYGRSRNSNGSSRTGTVSISKPSFPLSPPTSSHRRRLPQWASDLPREPKAFGFVSFDFD